MQHPRYTPLELIEELRDAAADYFPDIQDADIEELIESQAAQLIEEMTTALQQIADGAENPREIAKRALSVEAPLAAPGAVDALKAMLRPRLA